ncbi:TMEM175 family protein [Sphingobium rhizovicinum]|uniref:TMEM175 family protein n=1 Tax=Sphingobium rhizovicinum TaxID=432308 RepID=A0ABV7NJ88_9SPHN
MLPLMIAYLLSFVNVGLYWNNHHHLFQLNPRIEGGCCGRTCSAVLAEPGAIVIRC